jgi:uncharacterized membrane protein
MAHPRKLWPDWARGLAVLSMVEVHTLDAWILPGAAHGTTFNILLMIGGFAAPSFLFMAGLSQVLGDDALARRGMDAGARRRTALYRALKLLGIAYGFRVAEYLLGGMYRVPGGWRDILRVDILNVIAISLVVAALLGVGRTRATHVALATIAAAAVVLATPLAAAWVHGPSRILDYVYATWPRANFSLLNWAAFLLAGSAVGRLLAGRDRPGLLLALGAALYAAGWAADRLPAFYAHQDFWRTSPSWFAMRLGVVVALTGALQLVPAGADAGASWLRTLGRHSLLAYVASVEITYGYATAPLHKALSLGTVIAGIIAMIAGTWVLAVAADRLAERPKKPAGTGGALPQP